MVPVLEKLLFAAPLALSFTERDRSLGPAHIKDLCLALDPARGPKGTLCVLAQQARTIKAIEIPFLSLDQNALMYVVDKAASEPHRGRVHHSYKLPRHERLALLSQHHHVTKAWLQYVRAVVFKLSARKIAFSLEISKSTWLAWEAPGMRLPTPLWTSLLWRWYETARDGILANERYLAQPELLPTWQECTATWERAELIKQWRPTYYYAKQRGRIPLHQPSEPPEEGPTDNDPEQT